MSRLICTSELIVHIDTVHGQYNNIFYVNSSEEDPVHYTGGYPVGQVFDLPTNPCRGGYFSMHPLEYGLCEHAIHTVIAQVQKYKDTEEKEISEQANHAYQQELAALQPNS